MRAVAITSWVLTAGGGLVMLAMWLRGGGLRLQREGGTRFGTGLIFGHAGLAALGLVLLLLGVGWIAWLLLPVVAAMGFLMFMKWLGGRGAEGGEGAPEQRFPTVVVAAHGVFAAATFVLVLLSLL